MQALMFPRFTRAVGVGDPREWDYRVLRRPHSRTEINVVVRQALSLDSREAGCARLLCCPGSDDTMKALVTDGSVTLRTADLN